MKFSKKILPMVLAMAMVPAMSIPTFAEDSATASSLLPGEVQDSNVNLVSHTFAAYQIFKGDFSSGTLSNIEWGDDFNGFTYNEKSTAKEVAEELTKEGTDANGFAKKVAAHIKAKNINPSCTGSNGTITLGTAGYYLIEDTTDTANKDDAKNMTLLKVTAANQTITPKIKTDKPSVEKKVKENTKYTEDGGYGNTYNDVADYNMGDSVNFHLIGAVPDMDNYENYKYEFDDTLCDGLTAPNIDEIKVYLSTDKKVDDSDVWLKEADYKGNLSITVSGQNISVAFKNLKNVSNIAKGNYIIVDYSAVLNQKAVVGLDGNENKVKLKYSNNPNQSGSGENTPTGETPEDKVIVFTYELDVTKVDGQDANKKLAGAEFKLMNADRTKYAIVDDGKVTGWTESEATGTVLKSDEYGLFTVTGLDDNTYYLKETKAPDGYNTLKDPIEFVIRATTVNNQGWNGNASEAFTKLEIGLKNNESIIEYKDGTTNDGSVSMTVKNNKGSILPETGGIGTTIFYIVGVVLVLGAGVLLVTKKRMNADK